MKHKFLKNKLAVFMMIFLIFISAMIIYRVTSNAGDGETNTVRLVTSKGNITIELYTDMPITTTNFKKLVKQEIYDGTIFHRVVPGFVIQGGDPTGTGYGDSSIPTIKDELPNRHSNVRGAVAMAKTSEPDSASSQFFINLVDNSASLDANYTVFGYVTAGLGVVDMIGSVPTNTTTQSPLQEVQLIKAEFVH
ncbi:MAG TPA: peptidylprolyl isomerase [Candidatus Bathyarchaeia archaeon]|nr:peptidylprolyl isomerase [Candidatus Bathyarchaeia archaeon]